MGDAELRESVGRGRRDAYPDLVWPRVLRRPVGLLPAESKRLSRLRNGGIVVDVFHYEHECRRRFPLPGGLVGAGVPGREWAGSTEEGPEVGDRVVREGGWIVNVERVALVE